MNNLFNLFWIGLFGGSGNFLPLIIRVRRRVLARRQINGSRGEIDREGDDTGNEKEQQANGIERDDLQIERPGRLTSPFRPEDRAAPRLLDSHQRNGQPLASRKSRRSICRQVNPHQHHPVLRNPLTYARTSSGTVFQIAKSLKTT